MFKLLTLALLCLAATDATLGSRLDRTLFDRAVGDSCTATDGKGTCQTTSNCKGISYPTGLCPNDPADVQCCVQIACSVSQGSGFCRSKSNNGCSGTFVSGACPGSSDIQCCVPSSGGGGGGSSGNLPGLDATQSGHARKIFAEGKAKGLPIRGCEVAMATALVESSVHVYANAAVAGSESCPYDAGFISSDYDSVGIFQQRASIYGGGDPCKPMDPTTSAGYFFDKLVGISGWQTMSIGDAAQAVQVSAYPDRYQAQATAATNICTAGGY